MAKAKVLKKQWYPILAPKIFRNAVLGETLVYVPESMVGKGLTQNLMSLTNDVKRQNININFEVVSVEDNKAYTNIIGYAMVQSSIKRMVRRDINKIDMSFACTTSDKKDIRIKPLLITRMDTSGSIGSKLRKNAQDFLTKSISSGSYDSFINALITHKLQADLRAHLNKVYPLRVCEIRSMQLTKLKQSDDAKAKPQKRKLKQESKVEKKVEEKKQEKEPLQAS